jgi:hypothetical protein
MFNAILDGMLDHFKLCFDMYVQVLLLRLPKNSRWFAIILMAGDAEMSFIWMLMPFHDASVTTCCHPWQHLYKFPHTRALSM